MLQRGAHRWWLPLVRGAGGRKSALALPKSISFRWPDPSSSRFSGLRSRWMTSADLRTQAREGGRVGGGGAVGARQARAHVRRGRTVAVAFAGV